MPSEAAPDGEAARGSRTCTPPSGRPAVPGSTCTSRGACCRRRPAVSGRGRRDWPCRLPARRGGGAPRFATAVSGADVVAGRLPTGDVAMRHVEERDRESSSTPSPRRTDTRDHDAMGSESTRWSRSTRCSTRSRRHPSRRWCICRGCLPRSSPGRYIRRRTGCMCSEAVGGAAERDRGQILGSCGPAHIGRVDA